MNKQSIARKNQIGFMSGHLDLDQFAVKKITRNNVVTWIFADDSWISLQDKKLVAIGDEV